MEVLKHWEFLAMFFNRMFFVNISEFWLPRYLFSERKGMQRSLKELSGGQVWGGSGPTDLKRRTGVTLRQWSGVRWYCTGCIDTIEMILGDWCWAECKYETSPQAKCHGSSLFFYFIDNFHFLDNFHVVIEIVYSIRKEDASPQTPVFCFFSPLYLLFLLRKITSSLP